MAEVEVESTPPVRRRSTGRKKKRNDRAEEEVSPVVIVLSDDDSEGATNLRQTEAKKENERGREEASMRHGGGGGGQSAREPASERLPPAVASLQRRLGNARGKRAIMSDEEELATRAGTSGRREDEDNASVMDLMYSFINKKARSGRGRTDEQTRAGEGRAGAGSRTTQDVPGPSSPDVCFIGVSDSAPAGQQLAHAGNARRRRRKEEDVQVLSLKEVIAKEVEKINDDIGKGQSSNALTCPVCLGAVKDPLVTKCGHLFCGECIKKTLKVRSENNHGGVVGSVKLQTPQADMNTDSVCVCVCVCVCPYMCLHPYSLCSWGRKYAPYVEKQRVRISCDGCFCQRRRRIDV